MGNKFSCIPSKKRENLGGFLRRKFTSKKCKTDKPGAREFQQEDEDADDEEDESDWREDEESKGEEDKGTGEKKEEEGLEKIGGMDKEEKQIREEKCKPLYYPVEGEDYASDEQPVSPEVLLRIQKAPSPGHSPKPCTDKINKVTEPIIVISSQDYAKQWTLGETNSGTKYDWSTLIEECRNMPCPSAGDYDCDEEEEGKQAEPVKQESKKYNPDDWADFYAPLESMQEEELDDTQTDSCVLLSCRSDETSADAEETGEHENDRKETNYVVSESTDETATYIDDAGEHGNDSKETNGVISDSNSEINVDIKATNGEDKDHKESGSLVSYVSDKTDKDLVDIDKIHQDTDGSVLDKAKESDTDTLATVTDTVAIETAEMPIIQLIAESKPKGYGILRKCISGVSGSTTKRNVTWGPDVKPPAPEYDVSDSISMAFIRERSRLDQQKSMEQRHKLNKNERAGHKPVNNARVGMVTKGCRAPTPFRQRKTPTPDLLKGPSAAAAAATKGPDRGIVWPKKMEEIYSSTAKAYFIEQFQRTELFRSRSKKRNNGHATWMKALTPFQVWAIEHAGTTEMEAILKPKLKSRPNKCKSQSVMLEKGYFCSSERSSNGGIDFCNSCLLLI